MTEVTKILDDKRPIKALVWWNDEAIEVGGPIEVNDSRAVTKIVAYGEPAEYCYVPWFAVYCGDEIVRRTPAGHVDVVYGSTAALQDDGRDALGRYG